MLDRLLRPIFADRDGTLALLRRLVTEYAFGHHARYAFALVLMGVAAGCTALSAYLIGEIVNQAYEKRSFSGVLTIGVIIVVMFALKGVSTYGQAVTLARISNHIVAENQRRLFDKLLNEGLGFFAERHST